MNIIEKIDNYLTENLLFTNEDEVKKAIVELRKGINAPFVNVNVSTLSKHSTIMIKISLDDKKDWTNNIYQNSRYSQFSLENDPKVSNLEQFSMHYKLSKKFRKCKVKTIKDAITKINKYISEISK